MDDLEPVVAWARTLADPADRALHLEALDDRGRISRPLGGGAAYRTMNFLNPRHFFLLGMGLGLLGTWAVSRPFRARSDASAQRHAEARLAVSPRPPAMRTFGGSGAAPLSALDRRREFLAALAAAAGNLRAPSASLKGIIRSGFSTPGCVAISAPLRAGLFAEGGLAALRPFLERGQRARDAVLYQMCESDAMTSFSETDVREIVDLGFPSTGLAQAFNKLPPHERFGCFADGSSGRGGSAPKRSPKNFSSTAGVHQPGKAARLIVRLLRHQPLWPRLAAVGPGGILAGLCTPSCCHRPESPRT